MATITVVVDQAWISLAADPALVVQVGRRASTVSRSVRGEVRGYAGGRMRGVTHEGVVGAAKLAFRSQDRATIDLLASWAGQVVCVRDEVGRKMFAMFFEVPEAELGLGWFDVDLALQQVTYSEEP